MPLTVPGFKFEHPSGLVALRPSHCSSEQISGSGAATDLHTDSDAERNKTRHSIPPASGGVDRM